LGKNLSKYSALLLLLLLVGSSFIMTGLACASTPKPSVPEFTLKIVAHPYDVPPTATIDPYTGKTVITQGGYRVENKSIDIIVKNQPFTPYTMNGSEVNFYYQVHFKGHYETNWQFYWPASTGSTDNIPRADSDYTVISVPIKYDGEYGGSETNFPEGGQIDFQMKAVTGYYSEILHPVLSGFNRIEFNSEESDWSNTQTITIGGSASTNHSASLQPPSISPSESQNPTPNQSSTQTVIQPETDWTPTAIAVSLAVIAIRLTVTVVLLLKRQKNRIH
jgi:hypothetical protein